MIQQLLIGVATALGKNLVGWLKNSYQDGELQDYEFKQLLETSIVVLIVYFASYYGLTVFDASNSEWIASVVSLLVTPFWDAYRKRSK